MEGVNGRVLIGFAGVVSVEISSRAGQAVGLCGSDLLQPGWRGSPEVEEMEWRGNLEARTKMEGAVLRWRDICEVKEMGWMGSPETRTKMEGKP